MKAILKTATLAATIGMMASVASAAVIRASGDIEVGDNGLLQTELNSGETVTYTFRADGDLRVESLLTASGNGFDGGNDLAQVLLGLNGVLASFEQIDVNGSTANAESTFRGFRLGDGEEFTFTFQNNSTGVNPVATDLTFSVAAVPVPAAGLLLLSSLLGAGAVARRRRKAA